MSMENNLFQDCCLHQEESFDNWALETRQMTSFLLHISVLVLRKIRENNFKVKICVMIIRMSNFQVNLEVKYAKATNTSYMRSHTTQHEVWLKMESLMIRLLSCVPIWPETRKKKEIIVSVCSDSRPRISVSQKCLIIIYFTFCMGICGKHHPSGTLCYYVNHKETWSTVCKYYTVWPGVCLAILTQEEVPKRNMSKHVKSTVIYNIYGL